MLSQIRIAPKKPATDFFIQLDKYFHEHLIDGMDVNQYIASFGNPLQMPLEVATEIAMAIRRHAQQSAWKHYAPKPDPAAFGHPPAPQNPDVFSVPPKHHFLFSLTHPGITPESVAAAINIFANAIKTGLLSRGMAIDLDAPVRAPTNQQQSYLNHALAHFFRAFGMGHQKALQRRSHYECCQIRFHPGTINPTCIDAFTDALTSGEFPETMQICLSPSELHLAAQMMFAYPEKGSAFPRNLSVFFLADRTEQGAISHKRIFATYVIESEPSSPPSPLSASQTGLFAPANKADDLSTMPAIQQKLMEFKMLYRSKLDTKSLEHQLGKLKLRQSSDPVVQYKH